MGCINELMQKLITYKNNSSLEVCSFQLQQNNLVMVQCGISNGVFVYFENEITLHIVIFFVNLERIIFGDF